MVVAPQGLGSLNFKEIHEYVIPWMKNEPPKSSYVSIQRKKKKNSTGGRPTLLWIVTPMKLVEVGQPSNAI